MPPSNMRYITASLTNQIADILCVDDKVLLTPPVPSTRLMPKTKLLTKQMVFNDSTGCEKSREARNLSGARFLKCCGLVNRLTGHKLKAHAYLVDCLSKIV